jgi:hypothetical protein
MIYVVSPSLSDFKDFARELRLSPNEVRQVRDSDQLRGAKASVIYFRSGWRELEDADQIEREARAMATIWGAQIVGVDYFSPLACAACRKRPCRCSP